MPADPQENPNTSVSIIVPTYREAESLPELIERVDRVRREGNISLELVIVDDNSSDGTEELMRSLNCPWIRLVVRRGKRDLSAAVAEGLRLARSEVLVVMDADLQHPPEKIPEMLAAIANGHDFVIASRYVAGGATGGQWPLLRRICSRAATLLARPFTSVKDPLSGFFA
ncbi:MAG: glycosyltransferase, partial [Phycisphaerae bacterium]|nr:glycosyltransferase [Phycisphaerae bacterium]